MNYKESIDWLFNQFPVYQQIGVSAYKEDLHNILYLCTFFNIDYTQLRCIHIAGTNGKGSVSNMTASILQEQGYKVALFTSPHISDFRERIRVNGSVISELTVVTFCNTVRQANLSIQPSFFEITFALALHYFVLQKCDICVIETGLGGRLDSTNIIQPLVSLITNVSLDHVAILGDTIEKIAYEKAGIIKPNIPSILGEKNPKYNQVFSSKAASVGSTLYFAEDYRFEDSVHTPGTYLYINERTVRTLIAVLREDLGFVVDERSVNEGIRNVSKNVGFKGRFEVIGENPLCICDVAHNEDGFIKLFETLEVVRSSRPLGTLHIIYGASSDKDVAAILKLFPLDARIYFTEFTSPRSLRIADLVVGEGGADRFEEKFKNIFEAYDFVQQKVNQDDIVLVTGSFFLLSDFFEK